MKRDEIKRILMEMRTAENESQVNNILGKLDLIPEEKLEAMILQIGNDENSIREYLKGRLEEKKTDEKFPINEMFEYGISGGCVHLHMPVDLHEMIKEKGITKTIDTVNLQLLDAIEKIKQLKNDGFYKFRDIDSIYMISPILFGREIKFLNKLDFETQTYKKKELHDEKYVSEHPEAQLAVHIFGKENNIGTATIKLDVINSDEWQEKRKAQVKEFEEKGIELEREEK